MRISDWSSDVCSSDLISEATEELREQIKRMRRANLTPEQFGLYVQSHPDSLMVTAANKMRMGQKITVSQNLTGKLMEKIGRASCRERVSVRVDLGRRRDITKKTQKIQHNKTLK